MVDRDLVEDEIKRGIENARARGVAVGYAEDIAIRSDVSASTAANVNAIDTAESATISARTATGSARLAAGSARTAKGAATRIVSMDELGEGLERTLRREQDNE